MITDIYLKTKKDENAAELIFKVHKNVNSVNTQSHDNDLR